MAKLKTRDIIFTALVAAGFLFFYVWRDKLDLTTTEGWLFSILAGLVIAIASVMFIYDRMVTNPVEVGSTEVPQPALSRFLFHDTRSAPLWLIARLYVGLAWLGAGVEKLANKDGAWNYGNGAALLGFWKGAVGGTNGAAPKINAEYGWYKSFLQLLIDNNAQHWFAPLIAWGELLVGIGIIVGGLVGIAAFFGALMNMSFMLAGSASTNPVLFFLAVLLMLGWQVAGYYGLDRFILPILGAPWKPGKVFQRGAPVPVPAA